MGFPTTITIKVTDFSTAQVSSYWSKASNKRKSSTPKFSAYSASSSFFRLRATKENIWNRKHGRRGSSSLLKREGMSQVYLRISTVPFQRTKGVRWIPFEGKQMRRCVHVQTRKSKSPGCFGVSVVFANFVLPQQQRFLMASQTWFMGALRCRCTWISNWLVQKQH